MLESEANPLIYCVEVCSWRCSDQFLTCSHKKLYSTDAVDMTTTSVTSLGKWLCGIWSRMTVEASDFFDIKIPQVSGFSSTVEMKLFRVDDTRRRVAWSTRERMSRKRRAPDGFIKLE